MNILKIGILEYLSVNPISLISRSVSIDWFSSWLCDALFLLLDICKWLLMHKHNSCAIPHRRKERQNSGVSLLDVTCSVWEEDNTLP